MKAVGKILAAGLCLCLLSGPALARPVGTFREDDGGDGSQMGSGIGNSVSFLGAWVINVRGNASVETGVGEAPYRFQFSDLKNGRKYRSFLLTGAYPTPGGARDFYGDWGGAVKYMSGYLRELYGPRVNYVSWDNIPQPTGSNSYLFYFELWDEDFERITPVTVAYRFGEGYYLFAMGVNLGDLPELFLLTRQAAADFLDLSGKAAEGESPVRFTGSYRRALPPWPYQVTNPFQILDQALWEEGEGG